MTKLFNFFRRLPKSEDFLKFEIYSIMPDESMLALENMSVFGIFMVLCGDAIEFEYVFNGSVAMNFKKIQLINTMYF